MISFLLEEGVLTVGTLSGLFTTALLNSFKRNIIDPSIDKVLPSHKLDAKPQEESTGSKSEFTDMFPIPVGKDSGEDPQAIKWQTFLKDLITWFIIMFFLYLFWKKVLRPAQATKFAAAGATGFGNKFKI
jgi:large-conductance mechanosensitive channel